MPLAAAGAPRFGTQRGTFMGNPAPTPASSVSAHTVDTHSPTERGSDPTAGNDDVAESSPSDTPKLGH